MIDFADYGNAGAGASPRNGISLYIAPPSHTLETLPGSERMYSTDEPRSRAPRQHGRRQRARPALAAVLRRQAAADRGTPGVDPLQLPHGAALERAALVLGRCGVIHGDLDGGRHWPRPGRLRRNGVPRDGPRRRAFLQQPRPGFQRRRRRLPDRYQRLSVRHSFLQLPRLRLFATGRGGVAEAWRGQRALLRAPVRQGLRQAAGDRVGRVDRLGARIPGSQPAIGAAVPADARPAPDAAGPRFRLALLLRPLRPTP